MSESEMEQNNLPSFMSVKDGKYYVVDKFGNTFILEEQEWDKIDKAKRRAPGKEDLAIIAESLVEPKLGEFDLLKQKGSTIMRLQKAISVIYDVDAFL